MRIVAVIQARMGSTRMPNKSMALIEGMPMAARVAEQVWRAQEIDHAVLSIPDTMENDTLAYMADREGIDCWRGPEEDLLVRTLGTARYAQADAVVRITADCPLTDWTVIDRVVEQFKAQNADYASNVFPKYTYPAGIAAEVFSVSLLKSLDQQITDPYYRHYHNIWLWSRAKNYNIATLAHHPDLSHMRWTVDYPEDLEFVQGVYKSLRPRFTMADVLRLLEEQPHLKDINGHIETKYGVGVLT